MTTDPHDDYQLDDLRAEYAETGGVTSGGAVWLIGQVVVLREQVQRLTASSAAAQSAETALRDRIAEALADARRPGLGSMTEADAVAHMADAVMAVLRGLTLRELEQLHRPNTPPSRPEPHRMAAVELLRRTESYLSALHGSVARHDNLAANLGCAGCELRDQVNAELRRMAVEAQQPTGAEGPRTVCVCGHTQGEHVTVGGPFGRGRLLCTVCNGLDGNACKEFEAL